MSSNTEKANPLSVEKNVADRIAKKTRKAIDKKNVVLEKLKVVYVKMDEVYPNEWNPNRQNEHDFELLCRSIEEDGFTQPIICHKDTKKIVDGEHRWRAAKVMGLKEIPAVFVDMSEEQMKVSTIRHNVARGSHDIELESKIIQDFEKLGMLDYIQDSLMLDDVELRRMLEDIEAPTELASEEFSEAFDYTDGTHDQHGTENDVVSYTNKSKTTEKDKLTAMENARNESERVMAKEKYKLFKVSLIYADEEAEIVREVLSGDSAQIVLNMCKSVLAKRKNGKA